MYVNRNETPSKTESYVKLQLGIFVHFKESAENITNNSINNTQNVTKQGNISNFYVGESPEMIDRRTYQRQINKPFGEAGRGLKITYLLRVGLRCIYITFNYSDKTS